MNEAAAAAELKRAGADLVASLPCDRSRGFTEEVGRAFETVVLAREEDGVGICAGAALAGRRPAMSIQSSGLGNMMNAIMSLTCVYGLPLPVVCSWRGVEGEKIEAQVPFNSRVPQMLAAFGIACYEVGSPDDLHLIGEAAERAYSEGAPTVTLVKPGVWGAPPPQATEFPPRGEDLSLRMERRFSCPERRRLDAIREVMSRVPADAAVVSNIGVPSKEVYACGDRDLNFYMLGSYTQASAVGLGVAIGSDRDVVVVDGDGSLLGSSVLPVIASEDPPNLTVFCIDNGTFGSTGNQLTPAYAVSDLEAVARAHGIADTMLALDAEDMDRAFEPHAGARFVRVPVAPGNSASPDVPLKAREIGARFAKALAGRP